MKPFDLEAAKAGKKVVTANGLKARITCFDVKTVYGTLNMLVLITRKTGSEYAIFYKLDGEDRTCDYQTFFGYGPRDKKRIGLMYINMKKIIMVIMLIARKNLEMSQLF